MNSVIAGGALGAFVALTLLVILGVGWGIIQSATGTPRSTSQIVGIVGHRISGWVVAIGVLWGAATGMPLMVWVALLAAIFCILSFVIVGLLDGKIPQLRLPQLPHLPLGRRRNESD